MVADQRLQLALFLGDELECFDLPSSGEVSIGRAENNRVVIDHPSVSRQHARLSIGSRIRVEDLGSANGTFVRDTGRALQPGQTHGMRQLVRQAAEVQVGDSLLFGTVSAVVRRAAEPLAPLPAGRAGTASGGVVVLDPGMREVYAQAARAAPALISVLLLGETGVGKEVLARAIHAQSPRANQPFQALNCAALSETLLEGELFGYERGAFTGATHARPGLFEAADGGTVFLDEVGELSTQTQAKLLRVLEERRVMRIGARAATVIDVRFVAATNRDLAAAVEDGEFREDLYYRLNGITLTIPPLRARPAEIEPLVQSFIALASRQLDRTEPLSVSASALELLKAHPWPGNVRELRNVVERAVVLCADNLIQPEHLPGDVARAQRSKSPVVEAERTGRASGVDRESFEADVRALERARIVEALERAGGNQTEAAKMLGVSRRTLVSRLGELGLPRPRKG
jgi:transcriptional regulator with PAS, ATPase and Fis domain